MSYKPMDQSVLTQALDCIDAGKKLSTIADFYGIPTCTLSNINQFRNLVVAKDHAAVSDWVYGSRSKRLGMDAKKTIMKRFGYSIPENYLPKEDAPVATPEKKAEPVIDYRPYFQSLITQISTLNATATMLRDIGQIMHNLSEALSNYMPSVSSDLDKLKEQSEVTNENLNTVIQAMASMNDRTKTMMQYIRKG